MGKKITSYTGGPQVDPNVPCFSWWDYIMNRSDRKCADPGPFRGKGVREPPGPGQAIFTDEFYSSMVPRIPLQFGNLSPFLGAPVVPVLDLLGLSQVGGATGLTLFNPDVAERSYVGHLPGDSYPPLVAAAAAGTVGTVSVRCNPGQSKRIYPIFISNTAGAGNWAFRRHDAALATPATGARLPKKSTDGVIVSPGLFTSADIAVASFPPAGASEVVSVNTHGVGNQFAPLSPTIVPLGWLTPGKGLIAYDSDIFGIAIAASVRPAGTWIVWTE